MDTKATYSLKVWDHQYEQYRTYKIKCEVIDESKTQYKIRLLQPTHVRKTGDVLWVKKWNVDIPKPKPSDSDWEEPWWNKI